MQFDNIQKMNAPEMVAEKIIESLKNGDLTPGEKLPSEQEMGRMFGVGRSSVREAIKALVLKGYLEVFQGKGTFVKSDIAYNDLSESRFSGIVKAIDISELMEARVVLECKIAELAAQKATQKHIEDLKSVAVRIEQSEDNIPAFLQADLDFHRALAQCTENKVIYEMSKLIIDKVHKHYAVFLGTSFRTHEKTVRTVKAIIKAVEEGDAQKASQDMYEHLNVVTEEIKFPE
jgi:GntR family transcriptional repressor for pyruvate dehydrogenase complex